jgi:hypothetical protein
MWLVMIWHSHTKLNFHATVVHDGMPTWVHSPLRRYEYLKLLCINFSKNNYNYILYGREINIELTKRMLLHFRWIFHNALAIANIFIFHCMHTYWYVSTYLLCCNWLTSRAPIKVENNGNQTTCKCGKNIRKFNLIRFPFSVVWGYFSAGLLYGYFWNFPIFPLKVIW